MQAVSLWQKNSCLLGVEYTTPEYYTKKTRLATTSYCKTLEKKHECLLRLRSACLRRQGNCGTRTHTATGVARAAEEDLDLAIVGVEVHVRHIVIGIARARCIA